MKEIYICVGFRGPKDQTKEITLGELFGNKKITKDSKISLNLEVCEGSYGSEFSVAKVSVVE